ncbi:chlorohydrolase [Paenibacillus terrae HPL-003]|uniref:5-methylthioadenosine/S-adenosylhomocysteine deaminase n=1 Tax=Paenibacillus terrae (strain HPL-003) TaxID=985665 RepID=G7VV90_PAETH|nr:amidohydrolase [Paenibacillus terrae]AET61587.1 chlorohydrolase [Paenibacillus terrae HPL-003]
MRIHIKNAMIVTMNTGDEPYEGDILIEEDRIAKMGVELREEADECINAHGMVAMPGLINTHQHSPMSLLRAFSDDLKLMDWLERKMLPAEDRMTPEDMYWGAKLAIAEMIKSGTTTFADMYVHMDQIAEAVSETGIRASLTRGLIGLEDDGGQRLAEGLKLIRRWSGQAEGRITTMMGPHAPYTCPPEFMKEVMGLAKDTGVPVHIHLAETVEETVKIKARYNCTPTQYLYELGLFEHHHVLLAHAVHLNREDVALLKGMKGGIAHNPVSNLKLGCGITPVLDMLGQGTIVGLGTDGAGSATTLDLFEEIKAAAWLQKLSTGNPAAFTAAQALQMATVNGAKLLNLEHETGTLEVGKKADIILLDMQKPHLQPIHQIESLLAYSINGADVDTTIVNGRVLMRGRHLLTIDEKEVLAQATVRGNRIVQGL